MNHYDCQKKGKEKNMIKRIEKEYDRLKRLNDLNNNIIFKSRNKTLNWMDEWMIEIHGTLGSIYANESFQLRIRFNKNYPFESPEVQFIGKPPIHPHIYSNGHICLSILYDEWSPALTISAVCLSILSMLSSCKVKEKPVDNDKYIAHASESSKDTNWFYHDDTV